MTSATDYNVRSASFLWPLHLPHDRLGIAAAETTWSGGQRRDGGYIGVTETPAGPWVTSSSPAVPSYHEMHNATMTMMAH